MKKEDKTGNKIYNNNTNSTLRY